MSCLIINDIDAGVGRFKGTQATVNTQMVMGTLMNLCDHPTQVSNEEDDEIHEYREEERIRRVPIIVTGNDLSTLYAPLLRDGRMEKFYWQPTRTDIADMVHAMYRDDDVSRETVERLVARHEGQPLDFFGATRARMYDRCIVEWAESFRSETPDPVTGQRHVTKAMGEHLMKNRTRERPDDEHDPGDFVLWKPDFTVQDCSEEALMRHADDLAREQRLVNEKRLSEDYMRTMKDWDEVVREDPSRRERPPPEVVAAETMTDEQRARQEALERNATEAMRAAQRQRDEERRRNPPPPEEKSSRAAPPPPKPPKLKFDREWPVVDVATAFDAFKNDGVTLVDVRGARDHDREAPVGSVNVPAVIITGRPMHWETKVNDAFEDAFAEAHADKSKPLLILGGADATGAPDGAAVVLARLRAKGVLAGYDDIAEVDGGYERWNKRYTPAGKKRTGKAKYTNVVGAPGTICVGSEIITQEDGVFEGLMGVNG
jgi:type II secretory pathway pseudopilin PulG